MSTVAILGLGRIGSRYDATGKGPPRSHVGAVLRSRGLRLSLLVDPDATARTVAKAQWSDRISGVPIVGDAREIQGTADVVAICAPADSRELQMKAALWLRPRVIVIEKPLGTTLAQAQAVASRTRGTEAAVRVNFQRRFDPRFIAARAEFPGTPRSIVFRYGKGLFNYGSHMVDLLIDWFGAIDYVQAIGFERHSGPDPSISFVCRMAAGFDATLVGFSGTDYDLFEGEIYFVDRMLSFSAGGAKWTRLTAVDSLYYPGYAHLAETGDRKAVASAGGLQELYSAISAFLLDRKPLAGCDIQSAVAGMVVLDAACRSARQGGAPISVATADRALSDHMG